MLESPIEFASHDPTERQLAGQPLWECPHCGAARALPAAGARRLIICDVCRFVFPAPARAWLGNGPLSDLTLTRSTTERFARVRTDRYAIIQMLAKGAQGRLYLAKHRHLDDLCVIKVVDVTDGWLGQMAIERLRIEAQAGFRVNHPAVARVLDCDCVDDTWYFVMEHVPGINLRQVLGEADRLVAEQVVWIGRQAAQGLAAIHAAKMVHRDIKPSNLILLADGTIKITDLGLVKVLEGIRIENHTLQGSPVGTPMYMPPEQFEHGDEVNAQADLYSLGAMLYHLMTGGTPHVSLSVAELARKHKEEPVVWPEEIRPHVPQALRETIEACLAKHPHERPAAALDVVRMLGEPLEPAGAPRRTPSPAMPRTSPKGLVVLPLRNLSNHAQHAWVGDAVAEYLTTRFMETSTVHLADRQGMLEILRRLRPDHADPPTNGEILEAARLAGAGVIVMGSYHVTGGAIRITAHALLADETEPKFLARVSGGLDDLFVHEDELGNRVLGALGHPVGPGSGSADMLRGTRNVEANEAYTRGCRCFADGDYPQALQRAQEALAIDPDYLDAIGFTGACHARMGQYDKALEYHRRLETIARRTGDQRRLAEALANLGVMYYYQGEYIAAYEFLDQVRSMESRLTQSPDSAKYRTNLGMTLVRLNRLADAELAFSQAIDMCRGNGSLVSMVWPYNGMGSVLLKLKRLVEAKEYFRRALALAEEIHDRVIVGVSHMNLGRCSGLMSQFDEAEQHFTDALRTLETTSFWNGLTIVYEHLADLRILQRRFGDALECVEKRIELARRHENRRMESEAWEQKARVHEQGGDTEQAIACLRKSVEISQLPTPFRSLHHYLRDLSSKRAFE